MSLLNRVWFGTATTGTGSPTIGAATSDAFCTPAEAGAVNGTVYTWIIEEGDDFEFVRGAYSSTGPSFARTEVLISKINGTVGTSKMDLQGGATVRIAVAAEDLSEPYERQEILNAEIMMALADITNVAQFLGDSGNRFADSFDALTYVDTAGATNLDSSSAGLLKPTQSGTTVTINSFDSDKSQGADVLVVDRTTAVLNDVTVSKVGIYSTNSLSMTLKIVKRNSAGNYDMVVSQAFTHPGGGWHDVKLSSPYTVPSSGDFYLGVFQPAGTLSFTSTGKTRAVASTDLTGTGQLMTENTGLCFPMRYRHSVSVNNVTVASAALTAAAAPTLAKLVARLEEIDAITPNTDVVFAVTRDGGTTWTNFTVTDKFTVGDIHIYESDELDISGQPSGTQMKWRLTSANNKEFELNDIYLYWL